MMISGARLSRDSSGNTFSFYDLARGEVFDVPDRTLRCPLSDSV